LAPRPFPTRRSSDLLDPRPSPNRAPLLFYDGDVAEFAPRPEGRVIARHSALDQSFNAFFQMHVDLLSEIPIELAARQELPEPVHDSPGASTRLMPWSIRSKLDTSCTRCFCPLAVSSYVRTRR